MSYPQPKRGLTADQLASVTQTVTDRIYEVMPHVTRDEWAQGMRWYTDARSTCEDIGNLFGVEADRVAYALAALSPQNRWSQNVQDTKDLIEHGDCGALPLGINRAEWVLGGSDPDSVLGGRKVRSFARNINRPHQSHDVTLDTHMAQLLGLPDRYLQRKGIYDAISEAFRTVAVNHGLLPHQLQAALWIHGRGSHE